MPGPPWRGPDAEETGLRRLALAPLGAASRLMAAGAWLHRASYRSGWLRPARLEAAVVSVGNLAVGGTGKTPLAAWLALELHRRGRRVTLASRGYGGVASRSGAVVVVSDGRFVHSRAEEAGDEPMLLASLAPGVPVVVARNRATAGLRAISAFGAEILVLDDGFQHHRLHRDVDIVTLDGARGLARGRVLPRGPLREGTRALRFADAVGVVDGPLSELDAALLERRAPAAFRFEASRRPAGLRSLDGAPVGPPSSLEGREVGLLSGIAQPDSFRRTVEALGARVVAERRFPDHHRYRASDVEGLRRQAQRWITTQKDAIKLLPSWLDGVEVASLEIAVSVEGGRVLVDWLESRLRQGRAGDRSPPARDRATR